MGGFIDMVDALAKEVEKEKMKVSIRLRTCLNLECLFMHNRKPSPW